MNSRKIAFILILATGAVAAIILFGLGTGVRDRMVEALQSPDKAARVEAVNYFAALPDPDPMARAFVALMSADTDSFVRHLAMTATLQNPTPNLVAPITAAFDAGAFAGDPYSLRLYAKLLALMQDPGALDRIMAMASEADPVTGSVLAGALASLDTFDGPAARRLSEVATARGFEILCSAVARKRNPGMAFEMLGYCRVPDRRDPLFRMVREIGWPALSLLPSLYAGADQSLRLRIIRLIGQYGGGDAGGVLRRAIETGSPPEKREALRAAALLDNEAARAEFLGYALSFLDSGNAALASDALTMVERVGVSKAVSEVTRAYYRLPRSNRDRIIELLGSSGSPDGISGFLNSTNAAERLAMARAVAKAHGATAPAGEILVRLRQFAVREYDRAVMLGFLESLVQQKCAWAVPCVFDWRYRPEPDLRAAIARLDGLVESASTAGNNAPKSGNAHARSGGGDASHGSAATGISDAWAMAPGSATPSWKARVDDILSPRYGYDQACDLLVLAHDHFSDPDRETRRRAIAFALESLSDEAIPRLVLLLDADVAFAEDAADALAFLGEAGVPYLVEAVEGAFPSRARAILRAARGMRPNRGRTSVFKALAGHHDKEVVRAALILAGE